MKKIIVLAVVAILVFAAAGFTLSPGYVLIERAFNNAGGSSSYEANTSITDFGHANIIASATSEGCGASVNVYEKVEFGDPGCYGGGCIELNKTVAMSWNKSSVYGAEDTYVKDWLNEDSTWGTEPGVPSTGNMYENVVVNRYKFSGWGWPCGGGCP